MNQNPDLVELERRGWEALSSGPDEAKEFYGSVLAKGAQMLFPGGMRLVGKEQILEMMGGPPWQSFQLAEAEVVELSDTARAVSYKVVAQRDGASPYRALICSTYALQAGSWKLAIHQQTPA